jgi:formylglycine-generating enzyme required for sulfatase activity
MKPATAVMLLAVVATAVTLGPTLGHAEQSTRPAETESDAAQNPPRGFRDCADCPEMIEVPAGHYVMGSADGDPDEKPAHQVDIPRPFAVGKYEITFAEYAKCGMDGGCAKNTDPGDEGWGKESRPIVNVSWNDAQDYLTWLSRKSGKSYRLLSEAEWEYAARAGTTTKYAFGDTIDSTQARFTSGPRSAGKTEKVGSFTPNAWGLYDMHGNVWEWVTDCYDMNYDSAPSDGSARIFANCRSRVLRGGSWDYEAKDLRSSVRYKLPAFYRVNEIGFRVARDLP